LVALVSIRVWIRLDVREPNDRDALARIPKLLQTLADGMKIAGGGLDGAKEFGADGALQGNFSPDVENRLMAALGLSLVYGEPGEAEPTAGIVSHISHIREDEFMSDMGTGRPGSST